jgi:DNA-binding NarL/FixJ family response regulator
VTVPIDAPVRVLLADDHAVVRMGLRALLSSAPDVDVVGEAEDGEQAVAQVASLCPDVVIMDLSMDGMHGLAATQAITRHHPDTRVLVLTMHDEEEYLVPLLEAGAAGYVVKSAAGAELLGAVRAIAAGRSWVRAEAAPLLAGAFQRRARVDDTRQRYESLSERERNVFLFIAQGYTTSQIGKRLFISAKTVDTYRRRVNAKLDIADRADYVRLALDLGLLVSESPEAR